MRTLKNISSAPHSLILTFGDREWITGPSTSLDLNSYIEATKGRSWHRRFAPPLLRQHPACAPSCSSHARARFNLYNIYEDYSMEHKYRKKPVVIDAWQFTKDNYKKGVPHLFRDPSVKYWSQYGGDVIGGEITTLEGKMEISENDWIIRGVNGEYYPCKPDIFEKTYEKAY